MASSNFPTHLRLLGMAAFWGASWPWGRVIAQSVPPLAAASTRFVLASLVLVLWLYRSGRLEAMLALSARQWGGMACAAAAGVLGYSTFFMLSLQVMPAGKAAIVVTLNPAATLLLAAVFFGEHLNWRIALGMAMAATGALIAITGGSPLQLLAGGTGVGELYLLGCVACWVAYTLIGRAVLTGVDALVTTTVTALIGAAMLLAMSFAVEGGAAWSSLFEAEPKVWGGLAALSFGATALAYAWYFDGVKYLGAGAASGYITLVPVFGVVFSSLWLGESMNLSLAVGGLIAVAGMAAMHFGRVRAARRDASQAARATGSAR